MSELVLCMTLVLDILLMAAAGFVLGHYRKDLLERLAYRADKEKLVADLRVAFDAHNQMIKEMQSLSDRIQALQFMSLKGK